MNIKKHITKLFALLMIFCFSAVAYSKDENTQEQMFNKEKMDYEKNKNAVESGKCYPWTKLSEPNCCTKADVNDGKEFIKIKTILNYRQDLKYVKKTMLVTRIYGDESPIGLLKPFDRSKDVFLQVVFKPEMEDKTKYSCKFSGIKAEDLLIPVEIVMEKTKEIEVTYDGGIIRSRVNKESDTDGTETFRFYISNSANSKTVKEVRFKITPPGNNASMKIHINYSGQVCKFVNPDYSFSETVNFDKTND